MAMAYWYSVIPLLLIIPIAMWSKQVIAGLTVGLLAASYIVKPTLLGGIGQAVTYVLSNLEKGGKLEVIGFLYLFSGLLNLTKTSGGIKGFIDLMSDKIRTKKQAVLLIWVTILGTFISPNLRIVAVAPIIKALGQKINIGKERSSFIIETTAIPIIALIPVGTAFIGYMTSTIELSAKAIGIHQDPYHLFLRSIPYNFFSITVVAISIVYSIFGHPYFGKRLPEQRTEEVTSSKQEEIEVSRAWNLIFPISIALILIISLSFWDGYVKTHSVLNAFTHSDISKMMLIGIVIAVLMTFIFLLVQKFSLNELLSEFFIGGNSFMPAIILFALVWGVSSASNDLGFSKFVTASLGWIPASIVPPAVFIIGSIFAYFIGSSWGSWGLLMPIGVSMAHSAHLSLPLMIGVIFASGTVGALISPLCGGTVTISRIMGLDIMPYAFYKLKHSIVPFILAVILYGLVIFF